MGKRSTLFCENVTLTTGTLSILALQSAAAGSAGQFIRLNRLEIGAQIGVTTLGIIRGEIATRDTAATLTMTSTAPKTDPGSGASAIAGSTAPAGAVARSGTNASTDSGGTFTTVRPFAFANLNGYIWQPTPIQEILVPPSTLVVVRLLTIPATLTGWTFLLDIEEG